MFTKLSSVPTGVSCQTWIPRAFKISLQKLKKNIEGLLLHDPKQLLGESGIEIYKALCSLKSEGSVKNIGISVYCPNELETIIKKYKFDFVQLPLSIFDRRFIQRGSIKRLKDLGIFIHASQFSCKACF